MTRRSIRRRLRDHGEQEYAPLLRRLEADHVEEHGPWKGVPNAERYEQAMYDAADRTGTDYVELARALQWARGEGQRRAKEAANG